MQLLTRLTAILLFISLQPGNISAQHKYAYRIFDSEGRISAFPQMLAAAGQTDVVLFGELHNNPIAHWLQIELSRKLLDTLGGSLLLGAEMFETDNQLLIDEYFAGIITESSFRSEARLWNNYETDYRPLVELARENGIRFIATNIPRRYASLVHREGLEALDSLSPEAGSYIPPLPVPYDETLPGYQAMLEMGNMPAHGGENLPKAQAVKDATMAHNIIQNLTGHDVFLHFNGAYHSNNYEGIVWYLGIYSDQQLDIVTISTVEQDDISRLDQDNFGLADFIITVTSSMTKTY